MNLDAVIQQIRNYCPAFEGRVAGAADFSQGVADTSVMNMPAAFVLPLEDAAEIPEDTTVPGLWQQVVERIGVVIQVSNSVDRRGQSAVTGIYQIRSQIFRAILNWRPGETTDGGPDPDAPTTEDELATASGFFYAGGQLLSFDRARLFWQFEFALVSAISDADGFRVTGHTLDSIDMSVTHPRTGEEIGIRTVIELEK